MSKKEFNALTELKDLIDDLDGQLDDSFTIKEAYNTIKQALIDKDKRIKDLQTSVNTLLQDPNLGMKIAYGDLLDKLEDKDNRIKELEEDNKKLEYGMDCNYKKVCRLQSKIEKIEEEIDKWSLGERGCSMLDDVRIIKNIKSILKEEPNENK